MVMMCERCGAPLTVTGQERLVHCQFCGATTRVAAPSPQRPPPAAYPLPQPVPFRPVRSQGGKSAALIAVALLVLAAVGAGVVLFAQNGALPGLSGPGAWDPVTSCAVDANGDGVNDIAGMGGPLGSPWTPMLLDGRTGKELWHSDQAGSDETWMFCPSSRWFGVARTNFVIEIHDARNPARTLRVKGKDKLSSYALGKGCAQFKTADGSEFGVTVPGGKLTSCPVEGKLKDLSDAPPGVLREEQTALALGSRRFELRARQRGTPMLTVEASDGQRSLWKKDLPYAAASSNSAFAVGAGKVAVFAAKPGDRDHGLLVVLDQNTGTELYVRPLPGNGTSSVGYFAFNGVYFIAAYFGGVHAFDPKTGKQVWHVGD